MDLAVVGFICLVVGIGIGAWTITVLTTPIEVETGRPLPPVVDLPIDLRVQPPSFEVALVIPATPDTPEIPVKVVRVTRRSHRLTYPRTGQPVSWDHFGERAGQWVYRPSDPLSDAQRSALGLG